MVHNTALHFTTSQLVNLLQSGQVVPAFKPWSIKGQKPLTEDSLSLINFIHNFILLTVYAKGNLNGDHASVWNQLQRLDKFSQAFLLLIIHII